MNDAFTHPTVLVVDDEEQIRRALRMILEAREYHVITAGSGAEALERLLEVTPDLIVLDIMLPDTSGIELCERIRSWLEVPVLMLSVRSGEKDKISALESGADDYLTKPFSAGELVARVKALLRRSRGTSAVPPIVELDDLFIDLSSRRVTRGGKDVQLTPIEFGILGLLVHNIDRVVTWDQIRDGVWGVGCIVDAATLRVHVSNLRKKIESHPAVPRYVLTEPGVGLRFNAR